MHISDINEAVVQGRTGEIEDAFRAMVLWPRKDKIEGFRFPGDDLVDYLARLCRALRSDANIAPGAVVRAVADITGEALADVTYGAVAERVRNHVELWRPIFDRHPPFGRA